MANQGSITVQNVWSCELVFEFGLKFNTISNIAWSNDDHYILFTINSSTVGVFSLFSGQKTHEFVDKASELKYLSLFKSENSAIKLYILDASNRLRILSESIELESNKIKQKSSYVRYLSVEDSIDLNELSSKLPISFASIQENFLLFGTECGNVSVYNLSTKRFIMSSKNISTSLTQKLFLAPNHSEQNLYIIISVSKGNSISLSSFKESSKESLGIVKSNLSAIRSFHSISRKSCLQVLVDKSKREDNLDSNCFIAKNKLIDLKETQIRQPDLKDVLHMEILKRMSYDFKVKLIYFRSILKDVCLLNEEKRKKNTLKLNRIRVLNEKKCSDLKSLLEDRLSRVYLSYNELEVRLAKLVAVDKEISNKLNYFGQ
jgi:hypothetical protein